MPARRGDALGHDPRLDPRPRFRGARDYPSGPHRLQAGERVVLDRVWGYTVDTPNEQIRYVFDVCYHGEGEPMQCQVASVDLFPR